MTLLRSTLFNLWFYLGTAVLALGTLPFRAAARLGLLRPEWPHGYVDAWARFILLGLRLLCGTTWELRGRENLPADGAALIVGNHQSAFDTIVWFHLLPRTTYVLKRELLRIPVVGGMIEELQQMPVDRDAGAAAIRSLLKETDRAVAEGRQIVIFPEGTRVAPGVKAPLHPGFAAIAARSGLPIVPVTTDSGYCWGRRAFRKRPGVIHIQVHPPFPAGLSRAAATARLEALFAAANG